MSLQEFSPDVKIDNAPAALSWLSEQGARFALPFGRSKNRFEDNWPNIPHTLDEATAHAAQGGNVGILTGKHSSNIIALDRDVDYPATLDMLGGAAATAKIVRDNAPGRGKLLYRVVNGDLPKSTSWKPKGEKHPHAELLSNGRHAVVEPSEFEGGYYRLIDMHLGIKEVTPAQLDRIWWLVTGEHLYSQTDTSTDNSEYVRQVKDAWPTLEVFKHFHLDANGIKEERNGQLRLLGNGGLLVKGNEWYCHSDECGGDNIAGWFWSETKKPFDKANIKAFWDTVNGMADAAGIARPQVYTNGHSSKTAKRAARGEKGEATEQPSEKGAPPIDKGAMWLTALRSLGHDFALNSLEDNVEIDGRRLDDVTRSKIYLEMISRGVSKSYVDDVINVVASENTYHPVQRYLLGLQWDGSDHLDHLLDHIHGDGKTVTFADGNTQPLHSLLISRWFLGCVARALDGDKETAFKHQTPMLVFVGKQGIGKSSFVRWLCSGVGYEFHREGPLNPHSIDDARSMVTKWIWEVSELGSSLRRGDRDALKGFITQEWHTYRKPWGKSSITKPTLCNFVGTINPETGFLDDPTGHRRFFPVHVTTIDRGYESAVNVDQLWAQLVHLYKIGTSPELSKEERQALAEVYSQHEIENPLQTYLQMFFDIKPGNDTLHCFTAEIIQRLQLFKVGLSNNARVAGREINDALAPMGLTRKLMSINGKKGWGWVGIAPNDKQPPTG